MLSYRPSLVIQAGGWPSSRIAGTHPLRTIPAREGLRSSLRLARARQGDNFGNFPRRLARV